MRQKGSLRVLQRRINFKSTLWQKSTESLCLFKASKDFNRGIFFLSKNEVLQVLVKKETVYKCGIGLNAKSVLFFIYI